MLIFRPDGSVAAASAFSVASRLHFSALRGHGTRRVRADVAQGVVRSQQDANPSGIAHDLCFLARPPTQFDDRGRVSVQPSIII